MKNFSRQKNKGQAMLIAVIFFLAISLVVVIGIAKPILQQVKDSTELVHSKETYFLAEGALEDTMYKLKNNKTVSSGDTISFGGGSATITLTTTANGKTVDATANIGGRVRKMEAQVIEGTGTSFNYGIQSGSGGFEISGGSTVNGNVYSNGSIMAQSATITGSAIAANSSSLTADQYNNTPAPINSCTSSNCINFRDTTSTQDLAQSFKVSSSNPINKIQFYMKKVGNPADITVRIVTNSASNLPSVNNLLTTNATLTASLVTTSFGWVDVVFPNNISLDPSETYWVVLDSSSKSSSNYYIIGANNAYSNGVAKIGQYNGTWNDTSPSGLDAYFQLYLGGINSTIGGDTHVGSVQIGTTGTDQAWAHSVTGASVTGPLYCQTGSNNNKSCDTSKGDPPSAPDPISDALIQSWKDEVVIPSNGWTYNGNLTIGSAGTTTTTLNKINGNLTVGGGGTADLAGVEVTGNVNISGGGILKAGPMKIGGTLTVGSTGMTMKGTLWVVGNITVSGGANMRLDSSYGAASGIIVSDGILNLDGGANFYGSGQSTSYPLVVTTSNCPVGPSCAGSNAVEFSGGAGAVLLSAPSGTLHMNGGSSAKALSSNKIIIDGGGTVNYNSGLVNMNFSSGPSGGWNVSSWQEVQ